MDYHNHTKRKNLEIEVAKHADIIEDETVKKYVLKKMTGREKFNLDRI